MRAGGGWLFQPGQAFFCCGLWGWILDRTQVTLWDIDLDHQSCHCLHDHVEGLGVGDLGQWGDVSCEWWHVCMRFRKVVEACHYQLPDLHLPHLFRQLPEESLPLRDVCRQLHHIDTFSGEVLPQIDTVGVVNGSEDHIHIGFGHLSPVLHHQFLQWCDGGPQGIFPVICQEVAECAHYGIKLIPVWLGFHWVLRPRVREVIIRDFDNCRLLRCHVILELAWESSHTRVATSKTRQIMMILVGTAAYIGSMTLIHEPHPGWFFTLTNHHSVFTNADRFLGTVGGAKGADQRGITCRHLLLVLCTCSCGEKPSRTFWNDVKIHSQGHIKTYDGQSTMYPRFYWIFAKLLPGKNSDKILWFFT